MAITLDALQTLDAIDRRGSFAKAAEELGKATSALSYTVQKLEEQLGITLFQRQGRRSVLTGSGRLLLDEGRIILEATARLTHKVKEHASGWEPKLRIGLESTAEIEPIYGSFNTLLSEQPSLELDIQECVLSGGWEALELDEIDILIGAPSPVPNHQGIRAIPIAAAEMVLVVASSHPLSRVASDADRVTKALEQCRLVVTHDSAKHAVLRSAGLTDAKQRLYVQTMEQKIRAQLAGLGVGHLPRHLIQSYLDEGTLVELSTHSPTTEHYERNIAWKISNKGRALKRLAELSVAALAAN